jgi:hypothetical protein
MLAQQLPPSAAEYARDQRREIASAVAAVRRTWRRMGPDFDVSWSRIVPRLLAVTDLAQERVSAGALAYVPAVLEDTGQVRALDAVAAVRSAPLVGVAGDGRAVESLLYGAVTHAKERVAAGLSTAQSLQSAQSWLSMTTGTLLSDTARQGESLGMGVRPVSGYVRMLTPPSCSRCVILAGRFYRKNTGFQRHPGCDCRHIPASESVAGDLTVEPRSYFDSLTEAEQDKAFTKAGAEAIRAGADVGQVVNARRGMYTAQGQLLTREGTTSRGRAFQALRDGGTTQGLAGTAVRNTRTGRQMRVITETRATRARLMPETIAQISTDRDDYLRLLRANGYLA